MTGGNREGRLAVVLHDVGPATYEHCALIREWLGDLGVRRVTLCAGDRTPALGAWLAERRARGDAVLEAPAAAAATDARLLLRLAVGALLPAGTLRVDVRPGDFDRHPMRTRALELVLRHAAEHRRPVTWDELEPSGLRADAPGVLRAP